MKSEEKFELKEVRKFLDSIMTETLLLTQINVSQNILSKTNAIKIKKKFENNLKEMASKLASDSQNAKNKSKQF